MDPNGVACDTGCLILGGGVPGESVLSGLSFFLDARGAVYEFLDVTRGRGLHENLQAAYQRVRGTRDSACIAAEGAGCDGALAIAGQLPVDRLVLIDRPEDPRPNGRELRRVRSYARRNAVFCVADVLAVVIGGTDGSGLRALDRLLCNCRIWSVRLPEDLWSIRKDQMKMEIYRFLCDGVLPKSLAENPEMCIIYG